MEELIAQYLFINKACPLPGVGVLSVSDRQASFDVIGKQVLPPLPQVSYSHAERTANDFIKYISITLALSEANSALRLGEFCSRIISLKPGERLNIPGAGDFFTNEEGNIEFYAEETDQFILPPVYAERITHPEATHQILVGDKESNSALMTEFYSDAVNTGKTRWWIGAAVLFAIAILTIVIYYNTGENTSLMGSDAKFSSGDPAPTYNTPK